MPCFTVITIEIKDKTMAEKALKSMGKVGTVKKVSNGTYTIQLTNETITTEFRDDFLQQYGVEIAKEKARLEGYDVSQTTNEYGEIELTLRNYA